MVLGSEPIFIETIFGAIGINIELSNPQPGVNFDMLIEKSIKSMGDSSTNPEAAGGLQLGPRHGLSLEYLQ